MPELRFPFLAMRRYFISEMHVGKQVRQFMQQSNEEAIRVQIGINADTVVRGICKGVPVIAEHAFAFMCKR